MLQLTKQGFYCPEGNFYVDPWCPVENAVITHAHSDHARPGSTRYLCAAPGETVLRCRLGDISLQALPYGESITINNARVSLHPAGHILGSAQVRIEVNSRIACLSSDYKTASDSTTAPFEPIRCHLFVTEATFALPIYRWCHDTETFGSINKWWATNASEGRASVLYG